MTTASMLDRFTPLFVDSGLESADLSERLRDPVPEEHEGAIISRAYHGRGIRWARITRIAVPAFRGFNAVIFPDTDRPAPVFGADLADDGEQVTNIIVDTWGTEHVDDEQPWHDVHAPFEAMDVTWMLGSELEGTKSHLISDMGRFARSDEGVCALDEALEALDEALETMVRNITSLEPDLETDTADVQAQFCRMHAQKPGGRDMLVEVLGERLADAFLHDIFFPQPTS